MTDHNSPTYIFKTHTLKKEGQANTFSFSPFLLTKPKRFFL